MKMVLHEFFPFKLQCVSNSEKTVHTYQYQDPSRSKNVRYFQTEWLQIKDGLQILSIQIAERVEFRKMVQTNIKARIKVPQELKMHNI